MLAKAMSTPVKQPQIRTGIGSPHRGLAMHALHYDQLTKPINSAHKRTTLIRYQNDTDEGPNNVKNSD